MEIYNGIKGVGVSGGIDSAELLFKLMSTLPADEHLFIYTWWKADQTWNKICAEKVVQFVSEKTGFTNFTHRLIDVGNTIDDRLLIWENGLGDQVIADGIQYYYKGTTSALNSESGITYPGNATDRSRDPSVTHEEIDIAFGINFYHPFINLNKLDVKKMMEEDNMLDVISLTRSCVTPIDGADYKCGECYWCQERAYCFG